MPTLALSFGSPVAQVYPQRTSVEPLMRSRSAVHSAGSGSTVCFCAPGVAGWKLFSPIVGG